MPDHPSGGNQTAAEIELLFEIAKVFANMEFEEDTNAQTGMPTV